MTAVSIDWERQEKARRYATWKRALFVGQLGLAGAYLAILILGRESIVLRDALDRVTSQVVVLAALYFLILWAGFTVVSFPLTLLAGWTLPKRYGLSVQTFTQWLADWAKGEAIGLVIGLLMVEVLYLLLRVTPALWWLLSAVLYVVFVIGLAHLGPVLLLPLFYTLTPLEDPPLAARLRALAAVAGAQVEGVYRLHLSAKTTAANAALTGLGRTRRVVLGDTLLDQYTPREIEVVFAHELGHQVHRDITRMILAQSVGTLVALFIASVALGEGVRRLGYRGASDVATMPLLAVVLGVVGVLLTPLLNWYSRRMERAADCYALQVSRDPPAFISTMVHLANQNLAVYRPPRWVEILFDDHPSIAERVELAEEFARSGRCS